MIFLKKIYFVLARDESLDAGTKIIPNLLKKKLFIKHNIYNKKEEKKKRKELRYGLKKLLKKLNN